MTFATAEGLAAHPRGEVMTVEIGSTVWVFDANRRVYDKAKRGGGPIYREHFKPLKVVGETTRSWELESGLKVSKKTLEGVMTTQAQIDDACWVHENRYRLFWLVNRCERADILRQIDQLLAAPTPLGAR